MSYLKRKISATSFLFVSFTVLTLCSGILLSNNVKDGGDINNYNQNEWKSYKEIDGIKILFKISERHDTRHGIHKEYLLIKLQNTTNRKVEIEWKDEIWYDKKCVNCETNSDEYSKKIILESGETKEGDCTDMNYKELMIHSKFLNYNLEKLTKYNMTNITVSAVN